MSEHFGALASRWLVPAALSLLCQAGAARAAEPEPPRSTLVLAEPPPGGRALRVGPDDDLQAALNQAIPGDTIELQAGAEYFGRFVLPRKSGAAWITIRTSTPDAAFPAAGTRVAPEQAPLMARLEAVDAPALQAAPGAHHYRLIGLEFSPAPGGPAQVLVELGSSAFPDRDVPHHLELQRCYLHGDPVAGARRGIALNSASTAVVDSYLSDFKAVGPDAQAIAGWSGPGPFLIRNNHLEGSGENILFGGADAPSPGRIPSDIVIEGNHFSKPLSWWPASSAFGGTSWTVKNLFELKDAKRVLVRGNVFENNWPGGQAGFAILFTVRNQDGTAPWSVVQDVDFSGNVVRHVAAGVNILGYDDSPSSSQQTRRVAIRNNYFADVGGGWGGSGTLFQVLNRTSDVTIERNSGFQTGNVLMAEGAPHRSFVFRDNIVLENAYGILGTGTAPGIPTLAAYFPSAQVSGNVFIGGTPAPYPSGNLLAASVGVVFTDPATRLSPRQPYRQAGASGLSGLVNQP
jgi:hypothetical protein